MSLRLDSVGVLCIAYPYSVLGWTLGLAQLAYCVLRLRILYLMDVEHCGWHYVFVMCRPGEARKRTVKDTRSYIAPYVWPAAAVGLSQA